MLISQYVCMTFSKMKTHKKQCFFMHNVTHRLKSQNDKPEIAKNADPDQYDVDLHCLPWPKTLKMMVCNLHLLFSG